MNEIALGARGTYQIGNGGSYPAVVTNINDDGTVDVRADDGGQLHFVAVKARGTQADSDTCFIPN